MSVTVVFADEDGGDPPAVVVPYQYGDYTLTASHITCPAMARRHGESYIKILEADRLKESKQEKLL